jgi:hypothetical protein
LYLSPGVLPTVTKFSQKVLVTKDIKYNLSHALRTQSKSESGVWFLCATNTVDSFTFYALQVYLASNASEVQDYKKLLLGKILNNS